MKSRISLFLVTVLTIIPFMASAIDFQDLSSRYKDAPFTKAESAGISVLTSADLLHGNPDGTFAPRRFLNRAEFMKIVMPLYTRETGALGTSACFPDVPYAEWYWSSICKAKLAGIVQGNPDGRFHPERNMNYAEALKILVSIFGYVLPEPPANVRWMWYTPYLRAAEEHGVALPGSVSADTLLTRGQMARLVAAFYAESKGQLADYRRFELGNLSSSSSSSRTSSSASSRSSTSSSSSSSSGIFDPITDTSIRSQLVLLGEVSPVIGAARFFMNDEALFVSTISINLVTAMPNTVQSLLVYDEDRHYLGRATLNTSTSSTNRNYHLALPIGALTVERRVEKKIYFRAQLNSRDAGGVTNETIQISNVIVEGDGGWSNRQYTQQSAGSDVFPQFITARSVITRIANALAAEAPLVQGPNQVIGSFIFEGRKSDQSAKIAVQDLEFQVGVTGGVLLSNVKIGSPGIPDRFSCTVNGTTLITCSNIPESFGSLTDGPRTITVYGDVVANDASHASLRLTLNEPGNATTDGAVTWTDGTSVYTWVGLDSPLASGTYYRY